VVAFAIAIAVIEKTREPLLLGSQLRGPPVIKITALNLIDHHLRVSEWMERRALPAGTTRNRGMGVKLVSGAISAVMRRALAGAWPYPDRTARRTDSPAVIIAHIAVCLVTIALRHSPPRTPPHTQANQGHLTRMYISARR